MRFTGHGCYVMALRTGTAQAVAINAAVAESHFGIEILAQILQRLERIIGN